MAKRFWPDGYPYYGVEVNEHAWTYVGEEDGVYLGDGYSTDAIIVAADGKCRDNGKPWARAAAAAYFGPDNRYNKSMMCPDARQTSQRAKLWGALTALRTVQALAARWPSISHNGAPLNQVIIKINSEYVVRGMTEYVNNWMQNGWLNARGRPLLNQALFKKLLHQIRTVQGLGVDVLFWHVPREENKEASNMATKRLNDS